MNQLKPLLFILFCSFLSTVGFSQTTVRGTVLDASERPLPGVSVINKTSAQGTSTDSLGQFSLPATPADDLEISAVGYATRMIKAGTDLSKIILTAAAGNLSEVVVVGYGTQRKTAITNAVSTIGGDALTKRPVTNAQQALQGMAAGLTVLDGGGMPGRSNATLRVRGLTTINNNNPLIIVDGVEQTFFDMNPDDIESVSVLKDATSTAIFGSRGANGVIVVTTKRGKSGKPVISYNGYYALQQSMNQPEAMDLEPYMRLQQLAYKNVGAAIPARYTDESIKNWTSSTDRYKYPLPNVWYETVLRTAPQQNHTISISGGSETFRGRASARYMNVDGIAPNYGNKLNEVRINTDFIANKKLRFSADMNYRYNYSEAPAQDIFNFFLHGSQWAVPKYGNGTYGLSQQGNNPLMYAEISGYNRQKTDRLFGSIKGEWDIIKNLAGSVQYTYSLTNAQIKNYTRSYTNIDTLTKVTKTIANNNLTETRGSARETNLIGQLTYKNTWGRHTLQVMGGYQEIYTQGDTITAYRERFYNNDLQSLNAGTNDATKSNTGLDFTEGLRSYFARVNYNFDNKYFLEVASRYDASSRFSKNNQYAFFPSASAGWRISQEQFFENIKDIFSELKLRASYGSTGNNQIANYLFFPQLQQVTYTFGGTAVQGYRENILTDDHLTWEKNTQTNIGLDITTLNRALNITFDWYKKRSSDILLNLPIPFTTGLLPGPQNAATVDNKGIELTANYSGSTAWDLRYNIGANFSINTNKVVDLAGTGPYITGSDIDPRYITAVGLPFNAFWGYKTVGLIQTDAEAAATPFFQRAAKPGDVAFVDLKGGDNLINGDDMTVIGNPFPKYTFAANQGLQYKGFELNLLWQGAADVDIRLSGALAEQGNQEGFTHKIYTNNYWTPENPNARFPRPTKLDLRNQATTDRTVFDGSYFRLKNLQLGYSLPWVKKLSVSRAFVYVSATNVLTFSKIYKDWNIDPEVPPGRANAYPQTRLFTFGANITF